jgi:hypothetical protein
MLRKYHEHYGDKMEKLATETISTLQSTVKDNDGLFNKIGLYILSSMLNSHCCSTNVL